MQVLIWLLALWGLICLSITAVYVGCWTFMTVLEGIRDRLDRPEGDR